MIGDRASGTHAALARIVIANMKWRVLAVPLGLVALAASIDCSSSSTNLLCPTSESDIAANGACTNEGLVCPYATGVFDQFRTETTSDCFSSDFTEYACRQKKWVVTAQAASTCTIDSNGNVSTTACSPGIGRCVVAAGTSACQSICSDSNATYYSASCVSGQYAVTLSSCDGSPLDAGADAAPSEDASLDDASLDDSGVDAD
jgi:hypothetical protein